MLLEKYYEIIDRPSQEVRVLWKFIHIFFLFVATVSGYITSYNFALLLQRFSDECILYPNIFLKNNGTVENVTSIEVDLVRTQWGDPWLCQYSIFVPLSSAVLGPILIAFFIMFPKGGTNFSEPSVLSIPDGNRKSKAQWYNKVTERSWHLIIPSIIITGIFSIILLTSMIKIIGGLRAFCDQFKDVINIEENEYTQCYRLMDQMVLQMLDTRKEPLTYYFDPHSSIIMSLVLEFVCALGWLVTFTSLILRVVCVIDFKIVEVMIETHEDEEQLHKSGTHSDSESDAITLEA